MDEYQFLYYDIRILCIFLRLGSDFRRANMHSWPEVTFWGKAPSLRGAAFFLSPTVYIHHIKYNICYFSAKISGELPVLLCMKKFQRKIAENVTKHMFSENSDSYEFNEPKIIKKSHWTCEDELIEKTSILF